MFLYRDYITISCLVLFPPSSHLCGRLKQHVVRPQVKVAENRGERGERRRKLCMDRPQRFGRRPRQDRPEIDKFKFDEVAGAFENYFLRSSVSHGAALSFSTQDGVMLDQAP